MSVMTKIASAQGRKDEKPNKMLARELVEKQDTASIREVAENLHNADKRVQTDCLAVLEEVGRLAPELIVDYVPDFLKLVFSRDNRLVWAAMINLAIVADKKPDEIFARYDEIVPVIDRGSVITKDNGIKTLARVAAANAAYGRVLMPYLLAQLRDCRPKSVPQYGESISVAVSGETQQAYLDILHQRLDGLSASQQRRVKKLLKKL